MKLPFFCCQQLFDRVAISFTHLIKQSKQFREIDSMASSNHGSYHRQHNHQQVQQRGSANDRNHQKIPKPGKS